MMNCFALTIRKQPSGESFWIHAEPNYRVSTCTQKIQRMRGIPTSNVRLVIPAGEGTGNKTSVSLTGDDFQQRTLASLGLVGSDNTDTETDGAENGTILELAPITVYVQTPSGRRIKLKDCIDVEAMVDTLEKMVTEELESAHLLETSEPSSQERFRLYHERTPMRRGNPITKYKIKHMDVLKLKFGTDETDGNLKKERRKAHQKLERKKAMRKSESAGNLKKLANTRNQRASSASPFRPGRRDGTPKKQRLACGEIDRRKQLRKAPSNDLLKRLSQSLTSTRISSLTPLRGLVRTASASSEQHQEDQPADGRRNMMKARGNSDPTLRDSSRSRGNSRSGSENRKPRRNLKMITTEQDSSTSPRSHSLKEKRRKAARSKSRGDADPTRRRRRRRSENGESRSRSSSKNRPDEESTDLRKRCRSRSRSTSNSNCNSRGRDHCRNLSGKSKSANSSSNKKDSSRSRSGPRRSSCGRRPNNRGTSTSASKKKVNEACPHKSWNSDVLSTKNLPATEATSDSTSHSPEMKKQTEEVHPHKNRIQDLSATDSTNYGTSEISERKKETDKTLSRKVWKPSSQTSNKGIPDAFAISTRKTNKEMDSERKEADSPPSPVCVLVETLDMCHLVDEGSQGSSDIQSDGTKSGIYLKSSDDKSLEANENVMDKTVPQNKNGNNSILSKAKAKIEKNFSSPQENASSDVAGKKNVPEWTRKEKTSAICSTKPKFEKGNKNIEDSTESDSAEETPADFWTRTNQRRTSTGEGLPEKVIDRLKDTAHENDDDKNSASGKEEYSRLSLGVPIRPLRPSLQDTQCRYSNNGSTVRAAAAAMAGLDVSVVNAIDEEDKSTKNTLVKSKVSKPLQPSSRDTKPTYSPAVTKASIKDRIGKFQSDSTAANSPSFLKGCNGQMGTKEEVVPKSRGSIKDRIGKFQAGDTENAHAQLPEAFRPRKFQTGGKENMKSTEPAKNQIGKIQKGGKVNTTPKSLGTLKNRVEKIQNGEKETIKSPVSDKIQNTISRSEGSIADRVGKFQTAGKMSFESDKVRPGKIQAAGKENINAKPRGSIKDRLGKFQTGDKTNTTPGGLQMIGLATLGLKNTVTGGSKKKADVNSASTSCSFFCSTDDMTDDDISYYDSSDFDDDSDLESSSEDSDSDGEFESIHVIGPDLTPFEIQLDSESDTIGNIKEVVAEATGIPIDELRLGLQSEESDLGECYRTDLADDFKLSPGDILTVEPSTVVVKMPDGRSKLELSVFPGTLLSDIKEYIAERTGTDTSRQMLCNFEKNFDEELADDLLIATDCTLRLTVY